MSITILNKINNITQIIALITFFLSLLVAFDIFTFAPSETTILYAYIISGSYVFVNLIVSVMRWQKKLYHPEFLGKTKLIKDIISNFDNSFLISIVFPVIFSLFLLSSLTFAVPSIYTYFFGNKFERVEVVLSKSHGTMKLRHSYSTRVTNFDRRIHISVSEYTVLEKGKKIKIEGKKTDFGLLIDGFNRI